MKVPRYSNANNILCTLFSGESLGVPAKMFCKFNVLKQVELAGLRTMLKTPKTCRNRAWMLSEILINVKLWSTTFNNAKHWCTKANKC